MMHIEAGFTPAMRDVLSSLKGKTFKSFECGPIGPSRSTVGKFRINLGRYAVDVELNLHDLDEEPAGFDEMTWFSCEEVDLKSEFRPTVLETPRQYLVDERILAVELVQDHADYEGGKFVFDCDVALVIRTKYHSFVFARGAWFADDINIDIVSRNDKSNRLYPAAELWDDDCRTVAFSRKTLVL